MTKFHLHCFILLGIIYLIPVPAIFAQGTLLFREDFRGNLPSDPTISPVDLIGGYSDLPFSPTGGDSGKRGLQKNQPLYPSAFYQNDDHTYPNDLTRGYFMYIDPAPGQMDAILYGIQINNLCGDTHVTLSLWAADLQKSGVNPKIQLRIKNAANNAEIALSPTITLRRATSQADWRWENFTLPLLLPAGVSSIKLEIINKEVINWGNDWILDDIEVRLTTPPVKATINSNANADIVIADDAQTVQLKSTYVVDNTFGANLTSYWLYSKTGNMASISDWTPIDKKDANASIGTTWSHDLNLANVKEGYYRMVISNPANVLSTLCRAASDPIHIHK